VGGAFWEKVAGQNPGPAAAHRPSSNGRAPRSQTEPAAPRANSARGAKAHLALIPADFISPAFVLDTGMGPGISFSTDDGRFGAIEEL